MDGKSVLITGGARGIGRALAEELLRLGARVCLVDVLKAELAQTEADLRKEFGEDRVISVIADITKDAEFRASFEKTSAQFGKLDILVNNASIQKEGLWDLMMNINLGGTIRGTLLALEFMNPETGGVVLNMSSASGVNITKGQMPLIPVYTSTKAGVIAYTKCFALNKEVIKKKVRIVCLCPISTDTALLKDTSPEKCWDVNQFYSVDRGRLMTVGEVASIARQLIEDDTNSGKVALIEGVDKYTFI